MADWLDQPLWVLGNNPSLVTMRHETITQENGPYIANGGTRSLRAISNHARKTARSLPAENRVTAVDWNSDDVEQRALGGDVDALGRSGQRQNLRLRRERASNHGLLRNDRSRDGCEAGSGPVSSPSNEREV